MKTTCYVAITADRGLCGGYNAGVLRATEGEIKARLQAQGMQFIQVDRAAFANALGGMSKEFPDLAPWVAKVQAVK